MRQGCCPCRHSTVYMHKQEHVFENWSAKAARWWHVLTVPRSMLTPASFLCCYRAETAVAVMHMQFAAGCGSALCLPAVQEAHHCQMVLPVLETNCQPCQRQRADSDSSSALASCMKAVAGDTAACSQKIKDPTTESNQLGRQVALHCRGWSSCTRKLGRRCGC